ncbi:large subunit ribosomal protein L34e [Nematocida ausubeli]|uniref:50S ribosomal protein L34e n=2 Tax=Nematocida TaxID=586132 RepID=H8Z9H5_NEMA1|nr:50S ribosomal protein L34e [Nematocida parisii ERTm1]XP_052905249.1 50S ribosomal protein L34e [Nematocida ausubeli]EIJ89576.1 50S ribosomal protein L34e [Nematocida parisii ERTm3]KAI5141477.1 large subunit ribosomal protein L34e [Nematocida parisii]EHY66606.1 50S ribosomal protein L34e [Nematocida ausubeli]EIJ94223.1 50S ribosomal protein L34e [Nematocida parisii ERTm1]KAI5133780.1 large subunit ribosomal protein L34e [Nematocida ausubeli]|eukprot:XP_013058719.1 50S ribosomal protein L34e [Nematocida parisii ERTm1]
MAQRVVRAGYNPYITPSNVMVFAKDKETGKLYFKKQKKTGSPQKCGDCKKKLEGIPTLRPAAFARLPKSQRTINRAYGGTVCGVCVEKRILKNFLTAEEKQIKEMTQ